MNGVPLGWEAYAGSFAHMEVEVALLLGADLGDPEEQITRAQQAINKSIGTIVTRSRDHWTLPWGFQAETLFLNVALVVRTTFSAEAVLRACLGIEQELGRVRKNGGVTSRLIDIDILLYGDRVIRTAELQVPHPRLHERRFALAPLADVMPSKHHPEFQRTVLELLNTAPRP